MKPKVAILQTDGINCDHELAFAFEKAGGKVEWIHVNQLFSRTKKLLHYQILALPGGFSYGDDILSGKILANELLNKLGSVVEQFISQDTLLIGVCNGFQTLVRMGYLPWRMKPAEDVSLVFNDSGSFQCRWIRLRISDSACVFTRGLVDQIFELPVAHGEGKLITRNKFIQNRILKNHHAVVQYVDQKGLVTYRFPDNPNGSSYAIAGLTDETGRIFGLMPHPERNILPHQHPEWQTENFKHVSCLPIFKNAIAYFS